MNTIRWGILSTARIARQKVIPAMQQCSLGSVEAIASRTQEAAQEAAESLGIPTAYGSYEDLLNATDRRRCLHSPTQPSARALR